MNVHVNTPRRPSCRIDTHFHANIRYLSQYSKIKKQQLLPRAVAHLDVLCSTEHAYKEPLEAYDFLVQMSERHARDVTIVPGVENISLEGVEIIFLASSRSHLRTILRDLPAFGWSVFDHDKIARANAVTIVPHPFSPNKTGLVSGIGLKRALEVMRTHHYVEVCNGAFLNPLLQTLPENKLKRKINDTAEFPSVHMSDRFVGSVGSDAHRVDDLNCYGVMDQYDPALTVFENLSQRKPMATSLSPSRRHPIRDAAASMMITGIEAAHKRGLRAMARQV